MIVFHDIYIYIYIYNQIVKFESTYIIVFKLM